MVTLYVLSDYRSRRTAYECGEIITVSEEEAARLMADSPDSFALTLPEPPVSIEVAAPEAPPLDKAVRRRK